MKGDKIMKFIIIPLLFLLFSVFIYSQEKAGIVEFEIKNDINLENANTIIAEMLTTHLKKIKKYELYERILLNKVLEEQSLQLTGIMDEKTVVKVGNLFGLDIIIVGSAAKIGTRIFPELLSSLWKKLIFILKNWLTFYQDLTNTSINLLNIKSRSQGTTLDSNLALPIRIIILLIKMKLIESGHL